MTHEITSNNIPQQNTIIKFPISLEDFLKANIQPVKYIIKSVLPEKGKLLITGPEGSYKTFLCQNLALSISSGISPYLDELEITKKRVLYVTGEGGIEEMKRRLERMSAIAGIDKQNIHLAYMPHLDLCNGQQWQDEGVKELGRLLIESKAEVLIIEPIGQFWSGNENEKQQVICLTKLFDSLIEKHQISVILSHHWKKPTRNLTQGGYMASGSYWWTAWVDGHITLKKSANELNLTFEKIRSNEGGILTPALTIRFKEEDFWLECIGIKGEKITKQQLNELFNSFGSPRVKLSDLVNEARRRRLCARNTLEKYVRLSQDFEVDETDKNCFYVVRKGEVQDSK